MSRDVERRKESEQLRRQVSAERTTEESEIQRRAWKTAERQAEIERQAREKQLAEKRMLEEEKRIREIQQKKDQRIQEIRHQITLFKDHYLSESKGIFSSGLEEILSDQTILDRLINKLCDTPEHRSIGFLAVREAFSEIVSEVTQAIIDDTFTKEQLHMASALGIPILSVSHNGDDPDSPRPPWPPIDLNQLELENGANV